MELTIEKNRLDIWSTFVQVGIYLYLSTVETVKKRHWRRSGVLIVKFEQISNALVFVSIIDFNKQILAVGRKILESPSQCQRRISLKTERWKVYYCSESTVDVYSKTAFVS